MTVMDRQTELDLVRRLRDGDAAAFDVVYETFRPRLFAFLLRLARTRALAEDLLEETWLRLVSKADALRPDTRLGAWLFTVARNVYWSDRRGRLVEEGCDASLIGFWAMPEEWPSPFDLAAGTELEARLEQALASLPPRHREVLLLTAYEGLTPAEAAAVCRVGADVFRQRLKRARAALTESLKLAESRLAPKRYGT
jgi:RNA polymerase sigma-70 factor (ECF subfamily)